MNREMARALVAIAVEMEQEAASLKFLPGCKIRRSAYHVVAAKLRKRAKDLNQCVCTIGAQECPVHPGNTRTKEEKIQFRKDYDAAVDRGIELIGPPTS